jgi:hypothetical protein
MGLWAITILVKPVQLLIKTKEHQQGLERQQYYSWRKALRRYQLNQGRSYGGFKFWALVVDDYYSGYCWKYFLKQKSNLKTMLIGLLDELKNLNKIVKFLRLDDAGENFAMEKAFKQFHLGLQFELGKEPLREMAK